jgi:predicted adenylyl cyclase CyaB
MKEIEVKFLEVNVLELQHKLITLGALKSFEGNMRTAYYVSETLGTNTLRLRQEGSSIILAFKERSQNNSAQDDASTQNSSFAAHKEEYEVEVQDFDMMHTILLKLGYSVQKEFVKHRVSFKLHDWSFEFDTLAGIPTFLEIEAQSEVELKMAMKLLELDEIDARSWSGNEVRQYYESQ